ncbi:MAG: hypothetical protein A3J83_02145 [Elusimicrobia bacterium RIFOXYA2_FULL_40_6]|nr:MAG: hypothetical protein A3J83_02145 [Elusimicrobia bacterium RIFOXYA2_FULL_40_6]
MKKALVLAGGKGLRFHPEREDIPKPMTMLAGRPLLSYVLDILKKINIREAYIVVGHKKEKIADYFKDGKNFGIKLEYIENNNINDPKRNGLSDAVLLAKDIIDEPFITILGDEVYVGTKHAEMAAAFEKDNSAESMIAVYETEFVEEVKKNYSVKLGPDNTVLDLEEKPQKPWNNFVGCGTYLFRPSIFKYIEKTEFSSRSGRKELADTLRMIVKDNKMLKAYNIGGKYLNINYPEDLIRAEKMISASEGE